MATQPKPTKADRDVSEYILVTVLLGSNDQKIEQIARDVSEAMQPERTVMRQLADMLERVYHCRESVELIAKARELLKEV